MVKSDDVAFLRGALGLLSAKDAWPENASLEAQDAWMARVDAEAKLAGILTTVLHEGRLAAAELASAERVLREHGSRLEWVELERVLKILKSA